MRTFPEPSTRKPSICAMPAARIRLASASVHSPRTTCGMGGRSVSAPALRTWVVRTEGITPITMLSPKLSGACTALHPSPSQVELRTPRRSSTARTLSPCRGYTAFVRYGLGGVRAVEMSSASLIAYVHGVAYVERLKQKSNRWTAVVTPTAVTNTVAPKTAREISHAREETTGVNVPRMTSKHMDTMDELRACIERCVGSGIVHDIEEATLLRLARQATDEAQLLDYAYAFSAMALRENGVFGQRFHQLFREAEAFRAGMVEREKSEAA